MMACNNKPMTVLASLILLGVITLSGCVHRQFVTEPYPRWGEETAIFQIQDDHSLLMRRLQPADSSEVMGCMLIVHGMNEYIGRYAEVARYFSRRFVVAGFDLYGHGLSNPILQQADQAMLAGAERSDVSDAYLAQTQLRNLELMRRYLDQVLQHFIQMCDADGKPDKPVFIVAHSLGALVAGSYLLSAQFASDPKSRIQGIALLGPAFSVSEVPGWRGWLANPLIKLSFHAKQHFLYPRSEPLPLLVVNQLVALITVPLLDGLFEVLSWPGLRSLFTPISPDWVVDYLTDSEEEKARIRADGWIIHRNLLRYVKGIESEIIRFRRHMHDFSVPYYLVYSGHDPITPAWGSQDFISATFKNHPDNEVLSLLELSHHEHFFSSQPLRNELLEKIEQWLLQRLQTLGREKQGTLQYRLTTIQQVSKMARIQEKRTVSCLN